MVPHVMIIVYSFADNADMLLFSHLYLERIIIENNNVAKTHQFIIKSAYVGLYNVLLK